MPTVGSGNLNSFSQQVWTVLFYKLPFGISSAPEIFQCCMSEVLSGLPGVLCHVDDVLVFGKDRIEHDTRLQATLKRIQAARINLKKVNASFTNRVLPF